MANEAILTTFTPINHIVDGQELTDGERSAAADVDTDVDNTSNLAPLCNLILTVQYDSAPTVNSTVDVYRRDLNIVSTNDEPEPDATYDGGHYVGSFVLDAVTAAQYLQIIGVPLPPTSCQFMVENNGGQTIGASDWDLDVQPWTYEPAA